MSLTTRLPTLVISLVLSFAIFFGIQVMVPQYYAAATEFTISTVGDFGCNSNSKKTVSNIKDNGADLVLALGDYSYRGTAKCWFDIIKPIDTRRKLTLEIMRMIPRNCSTHI